MRKECYTFPAASTCSPTDMRLSCAGYRVGLKCLPRDLLDLIKSHLSADDALALQVALKRRIDHLDISVWSSQNVAVVCDPCTRHLVFVTVRLKSPPAGVVGVLNTFEKLFALYLTDVEEDIFLGKVCSTTLRSVQLQRCTVNAADPSLPKRLSSASFFSCTVLLGPSSGPWPLMSSPECEISSLCLSSCIIDDRHGTGALPITSPRLASLGINTCTYRTECAEPILFGAVSPSLKSGWLSFPRQWLTSGHQQESSQGCAHLHCYDP